MQGLNLSSKCQVRKNISEILFDDWIYFPDLFRKQLNDHHYSDNCALCQQTLHNCLAIFASNRKVLCIWQSHTAYRHSKDKSRAYLGLLLLNPNFNNSESASV